MILKVLDYGSSSLFSATLIVQNPNAAQVNDLQEGSRFKILYLRPRMNGGELTLRSSNTTRFIPIKISQLDLAASGYRKRCLTPLEEWPHMSSVGRELDLVLLFVSI